jgi:hypothetical protein
VVEDAAEVVESVGDGGEGMVSAREDEMIAATTTTTTRTATTTTTTTTTTTATTTTSSSSSTDYAGGDGGDNHNDGGGSEWMAVDVHAGMVMPVARVVVDKESEEVRQLSKLLALSTVRLSACVL